MPGSLVVGPWLGPSGLCGPIGSRLAPGFNLSLTVREFLPTTSPLLSLPPLQSLPSPLSPPWMLILFSRCLLPNCGALKGAPLLLPGGWRHLGQGKGQGLPRESPYASPGSTLGTSHCPFPSGSAAPSSAAAGRCHLVSGMSIDILGMTRVLTLHPPGGSGKELLH